MDFLLGALAVNAVANIAPYVVNSIQSVKRPGRVDIEKARRKVGEVRPVIPYRAPTPYTGGRVRALFIGINYTGTSSQLSGCVNDVRQMLGTFQRIGFPISECCILVDDRKFPNFTDMPTRKNIIKHMAWLVYDLRPGDVLFLHYSGHGTQTNSSGDAYEAKDQCLVPLDYQTEGSILDDDLFNLLIRPLPAGVRLTVLMDCCHSASMLDLPFSFVGSSNMSVAAHPQMKKIRDGNFTNGDVVMFSGCADNDTSADVKSTASFGSGSQGAGGAATQALTWALVNTKGLNTLEILLKARDILKSKGFKQVPQLSSSKPMDLYKAFSLFGLITVDQGMMQYVPQQYQHTQQPYYAPPPQQPFYAPPPQQPYFAPAPQQQQPQYHAAPQGYYPAQQGLPPQLYGPPQGQPTQGLPVAYAGQGGQPAPGAGYYPQALYSQAQYSQPL